MSRRQSDLNVWLRHCHWWPPVPGTGTVALSVGSCSGCGGRCHSVPGPPSENPEGGVGADGDAEAREGGQDDGDHGLHPHLLGLVDWFTHHSTAQQDDDMIKCVDSGREMHGPKV